MALELAPPPLYSRHEGPLACRNDPETPGVQILIVPAADDTNFQKGYLGAEGEHAALEGEVHLKGAQPGQWKKVSIILRTMEVACGRQIELGTSTVDLLSHSPISESEGIPTSIPFAIPLMADAPQCIHTPQSSLTYTLTATLHPADPATPVVSKDVVVHTRRFTSHTHTVEILPETHVLDEPVRVEAEVPRSTFVVGEPIPVYITIPPPNCELVMDDGFRLRNVKVELMQVTEVGSDGNYGDMAGATFVEHADEILQDTLDGPSSAIHPLPEKSSSASSFPQGGGACWKTVLSRSGASCRFHSSKAVRLRFILYQPSPSSSPLGHPPSLHSANYEYLESDSECISITQATLLHNVSFRLNVQTSFVDTVNRTERSFMLTIPIVIIPSPAPLPEVEEWVGAAYQKKHDHPPVRTVRHEDADMSAPMYQEGEAGPSYTQNGEPPPFEDRDVPPPPFFASESSTSNRLPTFQESENEIYIPTNSGEQFATPPEPMTIIGEGVLFGFSAAQQFDGHSDALHQTSPPPTVEEAAQDPDVTDLVDILQSHQALSLILERPNSSNGTPPPPQLDDPCDPPPSIDSEFRSLTSHRTIQMHPSTVVPHHSFTQLCDHDNSLSPPQEIHRPSTDPHAPPPYITPNEHEQVATPPPYIDFAPPRDH
ncbi:hypothetical protein V8B97DRAFT_1196035 [Scleroderma yunnanense]